MRCVTARTHTYMTERAGLLPRRTNRCAPGSRPWSAGSSPWSTDRERGAHRGSVSVRLLDREYQVACPAEERSDLLDSAEYLDARMREVRDSGKVVGVDRIAVISALNIANELIKLRRSGSVVDTDLGAKLRTLRERVNRPSRRASSWNCDIDEWAVAAADSTNWRRLRCSTQVQGYLSTLVQRPGESASRHHACRIGTVRRSTPAYPENSASRSLNCGAYAETRE